MPKTAMIRARTDSRLKEKVEEIFDELGLNATSAINIFYRQVLLSHGLPFDVRIPNVTTQKAMKDAATGRTVKGFKNADAMFKSLNG
jgi:DNA-damage-inducible protein J